MDIASRPNARAIGVVYLLYFVVALTGGFLMKGLVVSGDAAATAKQIATHEALYRSGLALGLIANAIYIAVIALFYLLFERVNRTVSLLAAFFGLVGCAVQIFGGVFQLAPLVILGKSAPLTFTVEQWQQLAMLSLELYGQTFNLSLVLFALFDLLLGWLIFRSAFLPRFLGVFLMIAGIGWLTFLWPPLATSLSSIVMPVGALAEIALMLWLVIKGVKPS